MAPIEVSPSRVDTAREPNVRTRCTHIWIPLGAGMFIAALAGSATVVPQLVLLHAFQALIYVAVILLARRNLALGFGAGFTIALVWNALEWLGPHLIQAGAHELWTLLSAGQLRRPDTLMVFMGAIAHCVLIVGCVAAFRQLRPGKKQWGQFLAGGLLVLGYFAAIVATMAPR